METSGGEAHCPRCGSSLHRRKPNSIDRTWALLITAALLYIPANVYPVMTFRSLGQGEPSTIIGGVKELIAGNMWPLALIVFVASILVPVLKLVSLAYLLISVRKRSRWRLKDRTLIYRIVEAVGRWSMVDVFEQPIRLLYRVTQVGDAEPSDRRLVQLVEHGVHLAGEHLDIRGHGRNDRHAVLIRQRGGKVHRERPAARSRVDRSRDCRTAVGLVDRVRSTWSYAAEPGLASEGLPP